MKLQRFGDTVVDLDKIAYAKKVSDHVVEIYFVGLSEPLAVLCGETQTSSTRYRGSADRLIDELETGNITLYI